MDSRRYLIIFYVLCKNQNIDVLKSGAHISFFWHGTWCWSLKGMTAIIKNMAKNWLKISKQKYILLLWYQIENSKNGSKTKLMEWHIWWIDFCSNKPFVHTIFQSINQENGRSPLFLYVTLQCLKKPQTTIYFLITIFFSKKNSVPCRRALSNSLLFKLCARNAEVMNP